MSVSQSQPECAASPATSGTEPSAVWHETLPIQINWTYRLDRTKAEIFCPGNAFPWRMARIEGGSDEGTKAYACLIAAAPDLLEHAESDVAELEYFVNNPSAWESFDDGVSEMLRRVVTRGRAALAKAIGAETASPDDRPAMPRDTDNSNATGAAK